MIRLKDVIKTKKGGETMKKLTGSIILFLITTLITLFVIDKAMAQDAFEVAPKHYKVLLENEYVKVLEVRIKPGEKEAMHTHPATVHIELVPTKVKITYPDGKSVTHLRELVSANNPSFPHVHHLRHGGKSASGNPE